MAYGDYIDATTMLDTCDADVSAPSGKGVDCRFVAQAEEATTAAVNRASLAIAQNSDELKARLDADMAITQVTGLTGFTGSTIDIDPTGGAAGNVNFTGSLYLGNGAYSADQESRDTLFQVLDSQYNEVIVEGVEVKVSAVSQALGSGFYSAGVVILTLTDTLPSGDYKLSYAIGSSVATLPDDALIRADIRGLHEAAGESQRINSYICAIDTTEGPADFIGASAVSDAVSTLQATVGITGFTLYVREGTYTAPTSWPGGADNIRIVGVGGGWDVVFTVGTDLDVTGDNCTFENIRFNVVTGFELTLSGDYTALTHCYVEATTPDGSEHVNVDGYGSFMIDCVVADCDVIVSGLSGPTRIENSSITGYGRALGLGAAFGCIIRNCHITTNNSATPTALVELFGSSDAPTQVIIERCLMVAIGCPCLQLSGYDATHLLDDVVIRECSCASFGGSAIRVFQAYSKNVRLEHCLFAQTGATSDTVVFIDGASSLVTTTTVFEGCQSFGNSLTALVAETANSPRGLAFRDCHFEQETGTNTVGLVDLQTFLYSRGAMRRCTFVLRTAAATGEDIHLRGFDGGDLHIEYPSGDAYDGTTPALLVTSCKLDSVVVDLGPTDCVNMTGDFVVELASGSHVTNLRAINMVGTWQMPLIQIKGSVSDGIKAVLDGLTLSPRGGGAWKNSTVSALVVELDEASILRRFYWSPDGSNLATGNNYLVATVDADAEDITIEDCHLDLSAFSVSTYFGNIFRLGHTTRTLERLRFLRNYVVGGNSTDACTYTVYLLAEGPLIEGNIIHHGLIATAAGELNNGTAFVIVGGERARIANNEIGGFIPATPTNGERKVLYQSITSSVGGVVYRATLIHNNVFRDLAGNIQAYIGGPAAFHPTGGVFAGHVDNTNHFMTA